MSVIKLKTKEYELKYTFNSFKYMQDFDVKMVDDIEVKPFKIIPLLEIMLMGALNSNPKVTVKVSDVQDYLESYIAEEGNLSELLDELFKLLQESSFFKSLQKK